MPKLGRYSRSHSRSPTSRRRNNDDRSSHRSKDQDRRGGDRDRDRRRRERSRSPRERSRRESPVRVKQERNSGDREFGPRRGGGDSRRPRNIDGSSDAKPPEQPKVKPNMGLSGKLAADTNTFNGVVVKYIEPPEARKPKKRWRIYRFKGKEELPMLPVHRQSAFLMGRDRAVADVPLDHPSCSKQHAVLQFRLVSITREDGSAGKTVKPYVIDLESSNGTYVNKSKITPRCYVELFEKDVLNFGYSSRDYVLLHEESAVVDDEGSDGNNSN